MAEAKEIPAGTYNLKLGETFQNNDDKAAYHTLRFDFKPKSVATETETYLAFGGNGDVQVAVPGETDSLTIYKGSQKPVKQDKECLLFYDPETGELRLEKLTSNIAVKKTRDADETSVNFLRTEIQKLREHSKTQDDEEMDDAKSSSSSSSSSSSGSGDLDSDSDSSDGEGHSGPNNVERPVVNESNTIAQLETSSDEEDANNSGSGEDDDELQDALEQQLNCASAPLIGSGENHHSEQNPSKLPLYPPAQHFHSNVKKVLDEDLQLSESSDED